MCMLRSRKDETTRSYGKKTTLASSGRTLYSIKVFVQIIGTVDNVNDSWLIHPGLYNGIAFWDDFSLTGTMYPSQ